MIRGIVTSIEVNTVSLYFLPTEMMKLDSVPVRGKHLDDLSTTDILFISLNKIATVPFTYFLAKFLYYEPNPIWSISEITFTNAIAPIVQLFIICDFFYTLPHWALHIQAIYGYIHKHHHRPKASSPASVDAVNVHPIEFFLGEYNHIFAIFIYTACLGQKVHLVSVGLFFLSGAVLASLNHTRFDVNIRIFGVSVYMIANGTTLTTVFPRATTASILTSGIESLEVSETMIPMTG